jgi:hypothetical protein
MVLFDRAYIQPAECVIKVSGQPITDLYRFVTEVSVQATRSRFTEATITFYSPVDESGDWLVADDPRLETWADIVIEADFQDATEEIMRGVILSIEPSFPTNAGEATVRLTCRDDSARLDREAHLRSWGEQPVGTTDRIILETLASEVGLRVDPASGSGQSNLVLRQNTTDIVFLQDRAMANGYELIFHGGQIYFGPRRLQPADHHGLCRPGHELPLVLAAQRRSSAPRSRLCAPRRQRRSGLSRHRGSGSPADGNDTCAGPRERPARSVTISATPCSMTAHEVRAPRAAAQSIALKANDGFTATCCGRRAGPGRRRRRALFGHLYGNRHHRLDAYRHQVR